MSRRKKKLLLIIGIIVIIALAVVAFVLASRYERSRDIAPEGAGSAPNRVNLSGEPLSTDGEDEHAVSIFYNGQEYIYNENLSALLILGIDDDTLVETDSSRNKSQADMILLAVFDPGRERCTLIQINRDTMSDVPVLDSFGKFVRYRVEQLALAHTYGNGLEKSCENTVEAISRFLYGIEIDNYFAFTMDAIPILNDLFGGVTVTIEDDFSNVDPTLVKGTTVTLTSENVENFVRARMNMTEDPTNINRMKRQRAYLTGLGEAMKKAFAEDPSYVIETYSALSGSLVTDCSVNQMSDYADRFSGYTISKIIAPEGESVPGEKFMEFYADEEALQQLVIDVFYVPVED